MKYKVGDKVKIREDLNMDTEYDAGLDIDMLSYKGKIGVITNVRDAYDFEVYYEIKGFNDWAWSEDMIECKVEFGDEVDSDKIKKVLGECELSIGENDIRIEKDCFYLNSAPYEAEEVDVLIELLQETKKIYEQFND